MVESLASVPSPGAVEEAFAGLPGLGREVTAVEPLDGGASNITCRVNFARDEAVVLRLQRARGIFEPYDVLREGEVLRRLQGTAVPVPKVLGAAGPGSRLGAPFIVMEWVDAPHMGVAGPEASFPAYVRSVASIHALDWDAAGLGFLGVAASARDAVASEIDAIEARMRHFLPDGDALLERALRRLRKTIPGDGLTALCQGDINVFNYLFRAGEVVAVVDWEQARISDPRGDIGQLVALSHLKGAPFGPARTLPFVQMYEAASERELAHLEWFRARWLWELGVIYHGWRSFNGSEPWYTWVDLDALLTASLAEI